MDRTEPGDGKRAAIRSLGSGDTIINYRGELWTGRNRGTENVPRLEAWMRSDSGYSTSGGRKHGRDFLAS